MYNPATKGRAGPADPSHEERTGFRSMTGNDPSGSPAADRREPVSGSDLISSGASSPQAKGTGAQGTAARRLRKFRELSADDRMLFLKLWALLPVVSVLLRVLDYRRTLRLLSRWSATVPGQDDPPEDAMYYALRLGRLARIAGRYVPTNGSCLRQSLLVSWLLRRRGIASDLRIGVQKQDAFAAHAWVEVGGRPVNDTPDVAERFAPFDDPLSARLASSP
jgi:hypothetical protein